MVFCVCLNKGHQIRGQNRKMRVMDQIGKEQIIQDYLSGNCDRKAEQELNDWLEESVENQEYFKVVSRTFYRLRWSERWNKIAHEPTSQQVLRKVSQRRWRTRLTVYAAAIALLVVSGMVIALLSRPNDSSSRMVGDIQLSERALPTLTLDDGQVIALEPVNRSRLGGENILLTDSGRLEYIPLPDTVTFEEKYNTLTVPRGTHFQLVLADGSRIWLNAGSELKYPRNFSGKQRKVYLKGEAYFEIIRDTLSPFIVHTHEMDLRVLGTTFNLQAYEDEASIVATLISGKISQYYPEIDREIVLSPLQMSAYDRSTGELDVRKADVAKALAWKENKILVREDRLEDILRQLSRWYDFKVVFTHPELKDIRFHLHSELHDNVQVILDRIAETNGIRVNNINDTLYISR